MILGALVLFGLANPSMHLEQLFATSSDVVLAKVTAVTLISGVNQRPIATCDVQFRYKGNADIVKFELPPRPTWRKGEILGLQAALFLISQDGDGATHRLNNGSAGFMLLGVSQDRLVALVKSSELSLPRDLSEGVIGPSQSVDFRALDRYLMRYGTLREASQGVLCGSVSSGPFSPVQRIDPTSKALLELETSLYVEVRKGSSKAVVATARVSPAGNFSVALDPGLYNAIPRLKGQTSMRSRAVRASITSNSETRIALRYETGIR